MYRKYECIWINRRISFCYLNDSLVLISRFQFDGEFAFVFFSTIWCEDLHCTFHQIVSAHSGWKLLFCYIKFLFSDLESSRIESENRQQRLWDWSIRRSFWKWSHRREEAMFRGHHHRRRGLVKRWLEICDWRKGIWVGGMTKIKASMCRLLCVAG